MEDSGSYIETGILELYAAGDLSPAEKLKVEAMLVKYPELQSELMAIEKSLEQYAKTYSLHPPAELRDRILQSLSADTLPPEQITKPEGTAMQINQESSFFKYAFAACAVLFLMSLVAVAVLYSNLQDSNRRLASLQDSNQRFAGRLNYMTEKLADRELAISVLKNPEYKFIKLAGTKQAPKASMMVAFNPVKKEVMIDMAAMEMPANDTEHQYQLWAMVNGKPVDLGVFDMKGDDDGMKKMKSIDQPSAFAVTLERRGGSPSPTMDRLMAIGSI